MESWKSTTNDIKSACGFCPSKFTTWSQRADHLAAHFRNGADMSMWANGWGFEPYVERLVENSIPPYLIGHERQTMQPYVARLTKPGSVVQKRGSVDSKGKSTPNSGSGSGLTYGTSVPDNASEASDDLLQGEPDQMTRDTNCWGRLEQELGRYVTKCKLSNVLPTDKQLQDQGRMIIYEDDDPWNWTCADNQQWLDTFKYQQGIGSLTEAMQGQKATLEEVPVLAPYVVKGGNKSNGKTGAAHTRNASAMHSQKRMSTGAIQDFKARGGIGNGRAGSWNLPAATTPMGTAKAVGTPLPDFDPSMEMDFDAIDFQNLDLGMAGMGVDDVTMTSGDNMSALTAALTSGGDAGGLYAPVTSQPMSMDMGGYGQQPLLGGLQEPYMTEEEMNELAGYSTSFH